jgi:hypothetical protein
MSGSNIDFGVGDGLRRSIHLWRHPFFLSVFIYCIATVGDLILS